MKALVLAAGTGSRLKPFTDNMPKALFPVCGRSLLEWNLRKLAASGVRHAVINVHHFAEKIIRFLEETEIPGLQTSISDESEILLETGGALKKAASLFENENAFLVYNADILSSIDISALCSFHIDQGNTATLAVMHRESSRSFLFDQKLQLCGWMNSNNNQKIIMRESNSLQAFPFSGIQLISPSLFSHFPDKDIFSLTTLYLDACSTANIKAFVHEGDWLDMGKPGKEEMAAVLVKKHYPY